MTDDTAGRVQAQRAALNQAFAQHWRQVNAARTWVSDHGETGIAQAQTRAAAIRQRARSERERQLVAARRSADEAVNLAGEVVHQVINQLAPGCGSTPIDGSDFEIAPSQPRFGTALRIGKVSGTDLPVVLPLLGTAGWIIDGDRETFNGLLHTVVARLLFTCHPRQLRVHTYDPDLTCDIGIFAAVREVDRASAPAAITTATQLEDLVESLVGTLGTVADELTALGIDSLTPAYRIGGHLTHPLHVLVLAGSPVGLSESAHQQLTQLARVGADRGLVILTSAQTAAELGLDQRNFVTLSARSTPWSTTALPGTAIDPDAVPSRERIRTCSTVLANAPRIDLAPTIDLKDLIDVIEDPWLDDGVEGIEAVIGRTGRSNLVFRLRTENPPMPNALVGGAVGQGKSTLLHGIIHTFAARYSPIDLEMVLIDFRDGVEFAQYGPDGRGRNWLPHVRALGLDYDPDFGIAVLDWVSAEMERRSSLLRAAGVARFSDFRRQGRQLPRLLVVIDEFHRLFSDGDTGQRATTLLEHISRTARGFGIHVVLSSQTISGISGLAVKADAIFSQFHNRLSLKNTAAESQVLLAARNTAAADLAHRGEVILNESLGQLDHNVRGQTAYGPPDYLRSLREELWMQSGVAQPPLIFWANEYATWPGSHPVAANGELEVALGGPISLSERVRRKTLRTAPDQALVWLGSDERVLRPSLRMALLSAVLSRPRLPVVFLDGAARGELTAWVVDLAAELKAAGAEVAHLCQAEIPAELIRLSGLATPALVVPIGLDQVGDLDTPPDGSFDSPRVALQHLAQSGATMGIHLIGWWQSRHRLEEQLGFGMPGVRGFILAGVGKDDLGTICGPLTQAPSGSPRILWFDRHGHGGAETLVPFATTGGSDV